MMTGENRSKRSILRMWIVLTGILAVVILMCVLVLRGSGRVQVEGPIDPTTGYRLEYTVSKRIAKLPIRRPVPDPFIAYNEYKPKPPPAAIAWIQSHVIHNANGMPAPYPGSGNIEEYSRHLTPVQTRTMDDSEALNYQTGGARFKIISFRHLTVGGYPGTWCVTEWPMQGNKNRHLRTYVLDVHPLHEPVSYMFHGYAEGAADQAAMERELMAIRDSVKLAKVKVEKR